MTAEGRDPDLGSLLSQLGQVQQSIQEAQESAAAAVVEGSAGGGAVRIGVSGAFEVSSVSIDPSVVDPADVEMLEDLVLAAARDALEKVRELQADALGGVELGGVELGGVELGGEGLLGGFAGLFDTEVEGADPFGPDAEGPGGGFGGQLDP